MRLNSERYQHNHHSISSIPLLVLLLLKMASTKPGAVGNAFFGDNEIAISGSAPLLLSKKSTNPFDAIEGMNGIEYDGEDWLRTTNESQEQNDRTSVDFPEVPEPKVIQTSKLKGLCSLSKMMNSIADLPKGLSPTSAAWARFDFNNQEETFDDEMIFETGSNEPRTLKKRLSSLVGIGKAS